MTVFSVKRSQIKDNSGLIQQDEYLDIVKRLGIPTASDDTLEAEPINIHKLLFNTTLNKLRIYDGTIWKDAIPFELANYYTSAEIDALFSVVNGKVQILQGIYLSSNPAAAEIYLMDGANNILSTLSVGFLNNEGTTFEYNSVTETLDLININNEILASIPISSFVSNLASQIGFNGTSPHVLELKDSTGVLMSSVNVKINNIQGLQALLDTKEPLITIIPVTKGGTGKNSITENSFFIGGLGNTMVEKTPQQIIDLILDIGDGLGFVLDKLKVIAVSDERLIVNPFGIDLAQTAVSAGTYTKVTVDNYGRVIAATQASLGDYSQIINSIQELVTNGIIVKSGNTTITRRIEGTTGRITVTNPDGGLGNPIIDLSPVTVIPGLYNKVTIDDYGRVIAGSFENYELNDKTSKLINDGATGVDRYVELLELTTSANNLYNLITTINNNKQNNLNIDGTGTKYPTIDAVNTKFIEIIELINTISGQSSYEHTQDSPAYFWTIQHNLNKIVNVVLIDDSNLTIIGNVNYTSKNQIVIKFNKLTKGKAYLT